jgi:RNA-binding protein YlmH
VNKTELLNRAAGGDSDLRVLLSRVLDKMELAQRRNVPAQTGFLSPAERAATEDLMAACGHPRHVFAGGYEGAERTVCAFLPDWQEEADWAEEETIAAMECVFPKGAALSHRDMLGALMGLGLTREKIGDILMGEGQAQVITLQETLPILLSQLNQAGRYPLKCREISLHELTVKPPEVKSVRDTVATLRMDAVAASGFSIGRGKAASLIQAGKIQLNHRECVKPDKTVAAGDVLSCRGMGKCVVKEILGESRKGRIMILIERYV